MRSFFVLVFVIGFFQLSIADSSSYLWRANAAASIQQVIGLDNQANLPSQGGALHLAAGSNGLVYMVGQAVVNGPNNVPYLWVDAQGVIQGVELKNSSGASFSNTESIAKSVAIASNGSAYIIGAGGGSVLVPYVWKNSSGTFQGVELKDATGSSFIGGGQAVNVAISSGGIVYIVGNGANGSGATLPYVWTNSSQTYQGIELKDSSNNSLGTGGAFAVTISSQGIVYIVGTGTPSAGSIPLPYLWTNSSGAFVGTELPSAGGSFSGQSGALSVAISSNEIVYAVGFATITSVQYPYLWTNSSGAYQGIELKNASGLSFDGANSSASSVVLTSNNVAYVIGTGVVAELILPYVWTNSSGTFAGIELKDNSGDSFLLGQGFSVDVSSNDTVYGVGYGFTSASGSNSLPYLWSNSAGAFQGFELTNTDGSSLGGLIALNLALSQGLSPADTLVRSVDQFGNRKFLKTFQKANSTSTQVYIIGSTPKG
ncbi:MAG: hypothetical protein WCG10_06535 [Chlamydiota bacterium]